MNHSTFKNIAFNLAAITGAFAAAQAFHFSVAQTFGFLAVAGIAIIAFRDYTPRRQVKITLSATKPVARTVVRKRVPALIAA